MSTPSDELEQERGADRGRTEPARPAPRPSWRSPWVLALAVLVVAFFFYSLPVYLTFDPAQAAVTLHPGFPLHYPLLVAHIGLGSLTFVTLVAQLWPWLRRRYPVVHRWSGRLYVFAGALPSAVLALVIVPWAFDGQPAGAIGNTISAMFWLVTTVAGYRAARARRFAAHRVWMAYSVAAALHIVWGRIFGLMAEYVPGFAIDGQVLKEWSGAVGLVINVAVAWWLLHRRTRTAVTVRG